MRRRPHYKLAKWSMRRPRTSTTTPAGLSLDLYPLQGLFMDPHINSLSFIPDPTSLYNMKGMCAYMWMSVWESMGVYVKTWLTHPRNIDITHTLLCALARPDVFTWKYGALQVFLCATHLLQCIAMCHSVMQRVGPASLQKSLRISAKQPHISAKGPHYAPWWGAMVCMRVFLCMFCATHLLHAHKFLSLVCTCVSVSVCI